jgi:hypothetical protein
MKQKYSIVKDSQNKQLIIREYAELDKEMLSLLCEETYEQKEIRAAIKDGKEKLIEKLRTKNLYPPGIYSDKIADGVIALYSARDKDSLELFFNDLELLLKEQEAAEAAAMLDDETEDLDEMLEEDFEESFEEKDDIKKIDTSLKIADDDYADVDDDN